MKPYHFDLSVVYGRRNRMKNFVQHAKKYIFAGLLAIVPLGLVYFVLRFIYLFIDQTVMNLFFKVFGFRIPGLGLVIIILLLYFIGLFSRNFLGKWLFHIFERIARKIPIVGTTYQVGKQISNTLSLPEKQVFKRVVLVNYLNKDTYTLGFVTGSLEDKKTKEKLCKVFIPTPPNPTTGTMIIIPESSVIDPGWSVEDGIRTVISAGIIGPQEIDLK